MTTILRVGNSEGTRRCDATCHNAKKPDCVCCCGGRYHGKGEMAQEQLTRDWLGDNWREMRQRLGAEGFEKAVLSTLGGYKADALQESVRAEDRGLPRS